MRLNNSNRIVKPPKWLNKDYNPIFKKSPIPPENMPSSILPIGKNFQTINYKVNKSNNAYTEGFTPRLYDSSPNNKSIQLNTLSAYTTPEMLPNANKS